MNQNETTELDDLILTNEQQADVKGGTKLEDCLVSSFQSGGFASGAKPGGALQNFEGVNTWKN